MAALTSGSTLKAASLLEQMKLHIETDAGKQIAKKVGHVYQLNIAPKVSETNSVFRASLSLGFLIIRITFNYRKSDKTRRYMWLTSKRGRSRKVFSSSFI